ISPVEPIYMAGRSRTAARPSRTVIFSAEEPPPSFFRVEVPLIGPVSSSKRAPSVGIAVDAMYLRSAVAENTGFQAFSVSLAIGENPRHSSALHRFSLSVPYLKYTTLTGRKTGPESWVVHGFPR